MSSQSVVDFLKVHAPDVAVIETSVSTATVDEAAAVHQVSPGQIAKTLSFWVGDEVVLVVLAGDRKVDNRKFRNLFKVKAKMLSPQEVIEWTSHPVGGVCPMGLPNALQVDGDQSLQRFEIVMPAAGSLYTAIRIEPERLISIANGTWVDVAQEATAYSEL